MADFLLIHGGSHGAWCWRPVARALARAGHRGHALDLPGAGADPTPRLEVTVDGCLAVVDRFVAARGLDRFVAVGHSLAGILLPGIALRHRDRVRQVVFVAALVLDRGERAIDLIPEERRPSYYRLAEASPDRTLRLDFETARRRFFDGLSEAAARSAFARLTPQPFGVYLEPAAVSARDLPIPRQYIVCRRDATFPPALACALACKLGGAVNEIDAGHGVMLSHAEELARLLVAGAAARTAPALA